MSTIGLKALFESKKAVITGILMLAVSVMTIMKIMTVDQWIDYTKWLGGFYLGAEAVDSGMGKFGVSVAARTNPAVQDPIEPRVREQE